MQSAIGPISLYASISSLRLVILKQYVFFNIAKSSFSCSQVTKIASLQDTIGTWLQIKFTRLIYTNAAKAPVLYTHILYSTPSCVTHWLPTTFGLKSSNGILQHWPQMRNSTTTKYTLKQSSCHSSHYASTIQQTAHLEGS